MSSLWKRRWACETLTKIIFIRNPFSKTSICVGVVFSRKEGCQEAPVTLLSTWNALGCPQHSFNTSSAGALVARAPTEAPQGSVCQGTDTPQPPLI